MLSHPRGQPKAVRRVAMVAVAISVVLMAALVLVYVLYGSQLALSQAADSLSDTLTQLALVVSLFISVRPPDEGHHYGHQRAEPIAALVASVMIGVVAIEVIREAIAALVSAESLTFHWALPLVFGVKAFAKLILAMVSRRLDRADPNPVLQAIYIDSRSDVAVCLLSIAGYFAARFGSPSLDAYLAIPVGVWIGWSAIHLARDTMPLLMGQAPHPERQGELEGIIRSVEGVRDVRRFRAQHVGVEFDIDVHVLADPELTLREAYALGRQVELRLVEELDICHAGVRVEPEGALDGASVWPPDEAVTSEPEPTAEQ